MNKKNLNQTCMGCFADLPAGGVPCPACGHDQSAPLDTPYQLPLRSILNGKYLVGKTLGEGGFGITYTGYDLNLDIKVAIKEYYPSGFVTRTSTTSATVQTYGGEQGEVFARGRERFVDEAKRLARFRSLTGIVMVNDFFLENGTAYIVMEYVEGQTLKSHLAAAGGQLPPEQVFAMMGPVFTSLAQIHEGGLIHRDISPDNIMITPGGQVKLLDFGAAREFGVDNKSLSVMLKHGYAPTEQYQTRGIQGPHTDVYALAATIYKAITGITPDSSMDRVFEDNLLPPSQMGVPLPPHQEAALLKGMAVRLEQRFPTVTEFYAALMGQAAPMGAPVNIGAPAAAAYAPPPSSTTPPVVHTAAPPPIVSGAAPPTAAPMAPKAPKAPKGPMSHKNKIIAASVAAVLVVAIAIALSTLGGPKEPLLPGGDSGFAQTGQDNPPSSDVAVDDSLLSDGNYTGSYDAKGKFSDYGVWEYHNYRYEGYFVDGVPNGEGTLYETLILPDENEREPGIYPLEKIVQGTWVNGFADGMIRMTWFMESQNIYEWEFEVINGYPPNDDEILGTSSDGVDTYLLVSRTVLYGVPPWAEHKTDPFVAGEPGNSASNMSQGRAYATSQGDWVYLVADHELVKMSADGSQTIKLENPEFEAFNGYSVFGGFNAYPLYVIGDYIYLGAYFGGSNAFLAKMSTDWTDFVNLTAENGVTHPQYYVMEGDWIYYRNEEYGEGDTVTHGIRRKNVDGTVDMDLTRYDADGKEHVSINYIFLLDGDYVYYYKSMSEQEFRGICRIRKDGTGEEELVRESLEYDNPDQFIADGDWLYYRNYYDGNLVKVHMGSQERVVLLDNCIEFLLGGDKIIYTAWDEGAGATLLHAVNVDGSGDPLLLADGGGHVGTINIAGDWVFYYDREGALCRVRSDGTGEQIVTH